MPLPDPRLHLLAPLFDVLPMDVAMPELLPKQATSAQAVGAVKQLLASEPLRRNAEAQSALWLYVDALDQSHTISQNLHTPTGSWLHGIMHRREGDFWNSHYWMRQARKHPAWAGIPGYDPDDFIDAVSAANGANPAGLLALQRAEWIGLMAHCLRK